MGEITWNICKSFYVFFIYRIVIPRMRICCIVPLPKWCLQMRAQGIAAGFLMNWASKPLWTQAWVFEWRRGFTHAKIFVSFFPFRFPTNGSSFHLLAIIGNKMQNLNVLVCSKSSPSFSAIYFVLLKDATLLYSCHWWDN